MHNLQLSSKHRALWSHSCWAKSIWKIYMSKFSKSSAALPPSVPKNPPSPPYSCCFQGEKDGHWWLAWHIHDWVDQVEILHGSRQLSFRFQAVLTLFYLQGWMPRGVSSGWCPSMRLRTWFPWRNLLTRPGYFGLYWRAKPCLILNIISGGGWRQKT
jgi:hypothetical protein